MERISSLFFCNSNMFVPVVLSKIYSTPQEKYIVMSDVDNIIKFFEFLEIPNVILIKYGFDIRKDGVFSLHRIKSGTISILTEYHIKELIFFHAEYGDMANWLIERLSSNIPVKYCKLYDEIPSTVAPISLQALKIRLMQFFLWGQAMDIRQAPYLFPSLPQSFFKKVKAETIQLPVDVQLIKRKLSIKLKKFDLTGWCVLLTGTAVENNWYDEQEYTTFINQLIEELGGDKVVSKCHPRYNNLYGKEKTLKQIPSFIPGNILLDCFDVYIGIESTLLVEAAVAGKKAISIIDWLKSEEKRNLGQHDFFNNRLEGKGIIYYPKNMKEFLDIVK